MTEASDLYHEFERDYQAYAEILKPINDAQPQRQGFLQDEFYVAINDADVTNTEVEYSGGVVCLPQLAPVEAFGWLHAPFYKDVFPDEYDSGRLLHYSDLPNIEPSSLVKDRLKDLAGNKGVLVFDFPSIDPRQPARILKDRLEPLGIGFAPLVEQLGGVATRPDDDLAWRKALADMGLNEGAVQLLGTQTYHVGRVTLKRPHEPKNPHLNYAEAFKYLEEKGEVDPSVYENGVTVHEVIDGDEAAVLQRFYNDAYATISDHPCEQGLTPDEFRKKLSDVETAKAICRKNGMAQSLCLVTENLVELTWVNDNFYYTNDFRARFGDGPVTWYPGIATDPESAGRNMPKIMRLFTHLSEVGDNNSLVVFDTPDVNTGFLDTALAYFINKSPQASIEFTRIGDQKYCAANLELI